MHQGWVRRFCFDVPSLTGRTDMIIRTLLAIVAAAAIAVPAMAQSNEETETVGSSKNRASGGHHYTGGPGTSTPHHMGDKK